MTMKTMAAPSAGEPASKSRSRTIVSGIGIYLVLGRGQVRNTPVDYG